MEKEELYQYIGDISQLAGFKLFRRVGGRADGMQVAEVHNGSGLHFSVLVDRCMDLGDLSFNGVNFSYLTKAGMVSPQYYNDKGSGWIKSFGGGMMTTCGLENVGGSCVFENQEYGMHGSISNTPAEEFCAKTGITDDCVPFVVLEGKMRFARLFGPNLWLIRKITCYHGINSIFIEDSVENRSDKRHPLMLLYHFNAGYPLLSPDACFLTSADFWQGRDDFPDLENNNCFTFGKPLSSIEEHCFYYYQKSICNHESFGALINDRLQLGLAIWSNPSDLPCLTNWRSPVSGDYCMGIEPGNCYVEGVDIQSKKYGIEYVEPFATKKINLSLELLDSSGLTRIKRIYSQKYGEYSPKEVYSHLYSHS